MLLPLNVIILACSKLCRMQMEKDIHKAIASHFSIPERPGACILNSRSHHDQVTVAEAAWCVRVAVSNYNYSSCEDSPDFS